MMKIVLGGCIPNCRSVGATLAVALYPLGNSELGNSKGCPYSGQNMGYEEQRIDVEENEILNLG
jgi:hypothetical protein